MGVIGDLSVLLRGVKREPHIYVPSLQALPDIGVQRLAIELDLSTRGTQRGQSNEPNAASIELDEIEISIVDQIGRTARTAQDRVVDELRIADQRLSNLEFSKRIAEIRTASPTASIGFKKTVVEAQSTLFRLKREVREIEAEREQFRKEHSIVRPAHSAASGMRLLKIGLLVFLGAVETIMNSIFLAKGSELGLLGGFTQAIVFAVLNVFVSFALGAFGFRQINHKNLGRKLIGTIALLLFLSFSFFLNVSLGYFREVAAELVVNAGPEVLKRLFTPFHDFQTWLFVSMGIVFSGVAFVDGIFMFDPYPGYGKLEQRLEAAHERFIAHQADLTDEITEIFKEAKEILSDASHDLSVRLSEYDSILQSKKHWTTSFATYQEQLEIAGRQLFAIYRGANQKARSSAAPERFSQSFSLRQTEIDPGLPALSVVESLRQEIKSAQEALATQVSLMIEEYENALKSFSTVPDILDGAGNG